MKNIIFDLGKVILDVDFEQTVKAFNKLAGFDTKPLYNYLEQTSLFDDFETGKINDSTFRNGIRALLKINVENEVIDHAWNAMLGSTDKKTLQILLKLKKTYKTFLLSNTNSIHIKAAHNYMQKSFGYNNFEPFFHQVYYSHTIGFKKPDPMAFQIILTQHHLLPSETLFIDDKVENVAAARQLGIQGLVMPVKENLSKLLDDYF